MPASSSRSGLDGRSSENAPGVTRTRGQQFRKLLLYPPELRGRTSATANNNPPSPQLRVLRVSACQLLLRLRQQRRERSHQRGLRTHLLAALHFQLARPDPAPYLGQ